MSRRDCDYVRVGIEAKLNNPEYSKAILLGPSLRFEVSSCMKQDTKVRLFHLIPSDFDCGEPLRCTPRLLPSYDAPDGENVSQVGCTDVKSHFPVTFKGDRLHEHMRICV